MPCASYQWISARLIVPSGRRTLATPFIFRPARTVGSAQATQLADRPANSDFSNLNDLSKYFKRHASFLPTENADDESSVRSAPKVLGLQQYLYDVVFAGVEDFVAFGGFFQRQHMAYQRARI